MERRPALGLPLKAALIAVVAVGVAAVLYVIVSAIHRQGGSAGLAGLNRGSMAKLQLLPDPLPEPAAAFVDADAKPVRLADYRGRAVVLNLWATWCGPCVKEMPTLAALQAAETGKGIVVLPVSMDASSETEKAKAFMAAHPPLSFHQDAKFALMTSLQPPVAGYPTTVLIDRSGMERATYAGDTDWSSPETRKVVEQLAKF